MKLLFSLVVLLSTSIAGAQGTSDPKGSIADLQQQAGKYLQEQKPQLAIPILRQLVSLNPQDVNAHGDLGVLLFFQNNYPEAITEMRAALRLQPSLWRIEALLGIAEKRTGDLPAAETDLGNSFPNLDDIKIQKQAGLELIEIACANGELEQATAIAAKLEKIAPQDPQVLLASYQVSLQMANQALISMAIAAPDSAQLHMMMADQFVLQGDSDNAIIQYHEAIRLNPRLPGVHFELAVQLKGSSDPALRAQAGHEFRTALSVNQADEKAWRGLGEIMAEKGDFPGAKEDYTKALALFPKDSDAETDLAKLLEANGDTKTATSLLESAVRDDPTNIVAHYQLSAVYRKAGRTADASHEMEQFAHYKALKDGLGKVFQQFRQQDIPAEKDTQSSRR
ncbi:MAG TPA: tetratricopeptide repeat protein [Terriglobales bacterium]|nr:tetratricopeptide repeat protein [Terriglobales bacterium]